MSVKPLTLDLPYPPSVNTYWRHVGAKVLVSARGRQYRTDVHAAMLAQGARPHSGRLAVDVRLHPPDGRRRDLDNTLKALLDALQHGGAYEDDSQIDLLLVRRCPRAPGGKAVVVIAALEDAAHA